MEDSKELSDELSQIILRNKLEDELDELRGAMNELEGPREVGLELKVTKGRATY